jgi:hypothetical protein
LKRHGYSRDGRDGLVGCEIERGSVDGRTEGDEVSKQKQTEKERERTRNKRTRRTSSSLAPHLQLLGSVDGWVSSGTGRSSGELRSGSDFDPETGDDSFGLTSQAGEGLDLRKGRAVSKIQKALVDLVHGHRAERSENVPLGYRKILHLRSWALRRTSPA